jgi:hypothetical protein
MSNPNELTLKQVSTLVEADHKPRVATFLFSYHDLREYRVVYWAPVLGVQLGGIHDTYKRAQASLQKEDWEERARLLLEYELSNARVRKEQLEKEFLAVADRIHDIRRALISMEEET